eukprot:1042476-Rhodomonas_salina.1
MSERIAVARADPQRENFLQCPTSKRERVPRVHTSIHKRRARTYKWHTICIHERHARSGKGGRPEGRRWRGGGGPCGLRLSAPPPAAARGCERVSTRCQFALTNLV